MAERQVRVLHVLGRLNPGGLETSLLHLVRNIDRQKFQLDFFTLSGKPGRYNSQVEALGCKVIPCRLGRNPLAFARRFRRLLREGGYDVVHSHVHHFSGAILRWAHAERIPARIAHSRTTESGKSLTLQRRLYQRLMKSWIQHYATHGLAVSKVAAAALFGKAWEADGRFRVLYSGIDVRPFEAPINRCAVRHGLGIPTDAPVIGHVGSFRQAKNHRFLLQVAAEFLKIRPETCFLLVGDGALRPEMEALAQSLGIGKHVHFLGNRDDIPQLMCAAMDAFLFPSRYEGLPRVLIEAQAAGLRCLVSSNVTTEVAVIPGSVVFVDLSDGLETWVAQLDQLLRLSRIPKENALDGIKRSQFSLQSSTDALCKLYQDGLR